MEEKLRILIAKPGLDTHERGAKIISRTLIEAGMEVIYMAQINLTIPQIISCAIEEDVNLIGLSILSGAHLSICRNIIDEMKKRNIDDMPVIVGGVIPRHDVPKLKEMGIREVFGPGIPTETVVEYVKALQG
ncbi:MAG: cobalamin-dependent protein [Thermodesulfobacteriota bacterium]